MNGRKLLTLGCWLLAAAVLAWSFGTAFAAQNNKVTRDQVAKKFGKVTPSEQKAAIKKNQQMGLMSGISELARSGPATLAGYRTISAPTATGLSARSRRAPSHPSPSMDGGTGYTAPYRHHQRRLSRTGELGTCHCDSHSRWSIGVITGFTIGARRRVHALPSSPSRMLPDTGATPTPRRHSSAAHSPAASASSSTDCRAWDLPEQRRQPGSRLRAVHPGCRSRNCTFSGQAADYYEIALVEYHREDALGPAADQAAGLRAAGDHRWSLAAIAAVPILTALRYMKPDGSAGYWRRQPPLPGPHHRRTGESTWRSERSD